MRVATGDTDERVVQAIHLTINGMVARSLGIGTGTVQRISGERAMSLRAAEQ